MVLSDVNIGEGYTILFCVILATFQNSKIIFKNVKTSHTKIGAAPALMEFAL